MTECKIVSNDEMKAHMRKIHLPEHLIEEVFQKEAELAKSLGKQSVQGSLDIKDQSNKK